MKEQARMLRILEYVGDRDWVDEQISKRMVKGSSVLPNGRGVIREAVVGDITELLPLVEQSPKECAG